MAVRCEIRGEPAAEEAATAPGRKRLTGFRRRTRHRVRALAATPKPVLALWFVMVLAILAGAVLRLSNLLDYQGFRGDQARDAFVYAAMRQGRWPTLGPASSYGGYDLPPTYYYLVFPFTLISPQPIWQLLPNVLGSIATLILLPLYCYRFVLRRLSDRRRLLGATVATVWAAVSVLGLLCTSAEWNPYVIPPLLLLDVMILSRLLDRGRRRRVGLWCVAGLVNGVLLGVHSTALFVVPIYFALFCVLDGHRHRQWSGPLAAWAVLLATLLPYLIGEFGRDFANTRMLVEALLHTPSASVAVRLGRMNALQSYGSAQSLFGMSPANLPDPARWLWCLVPLAMFPLWRVDRRMVVLWGSLSGLFLLVGSSYDGVLFPHYVLLLCFTAPLFLAGAALRAGHGRARTALALCCAALMAASIVVNAAGDAADLRAAHSATAPPNVQDIRRALARVPFGAVICPAAGRVAALRYLDTYTSTRHHRFATACRAGDYAIVPRGVPLPRGVTMFERPRGETIVRQE